MAARKKATARSTGNGKKKASAKKVVAAKKVATLNVKDPLTKGGIIKAMTDMTALP
jgi:hypothetical protein